MLRTSVILKLIVLSGTSVAYMAGCGPAPRAICSADADCLPCERCVDGVCELDEAQLNACGECGPEPTEVCGDESDNDCDGLTDENCDACEGVVCDDPPGPCYHPNGVCTSGGACVYDLRDDGTTCDDGDPCTDADRCTAGACAGVPLRCDTPPVATCVDASTLRTFETQGDCVGGECVYEHQDVTCDSGCEDGACLGCEGVVCDDPPTACHASPGTCIGGACVYDFMEGEPCDDGDACTITDTCQGDSCRGTQVVCNDPPADTCHDGATLRTFDTQGTCTGGDCTYGYQDTPCPGGCQNGACLDDPCEGVVCDDPPDDGCADAQTLRQYEEHGTCTDGACDYPYVDIHCPAGCADGACNPEDWSLWSRTYSSTGSDRSVGIAAVSGGGAVLVGDSVVNMLNADALILEVDPSGNVLRGDHYAFGDGDVVDFAMMPDGDLLVAKRGIGFYLLRVDSTGQVGWARSYGFEGRNLRPGAGGILIAGGVTSGFRDHGAVLKVSGGGGVSWVRPYAKENAEGRLYALVPTSDGGVLAAGELWWQEEMGWWWERGAWILKLDGDGETEWEVVLAEPDTSTGYTLRTVLEDGDQNAVAAGWTGELHADDGSWTDDKDGWIVKLDPSGELVWQKAVDGEHSEAFRTIAAGAEGYLLGGEANSEAWMVHLSASGDPVWLRTYGWSSIGVELRSLVPLPGGGIYMTVLQQNFLPTGAAEFEAWKLDDVGDVPACDLHAYGIAVRNTTAQDIDLAPDAVSANVNSSTVEVSRTSSQVTAETRCAQ